MSLYKKISHVTYNIRNYKVQWSTQKKTNNKDYRIPPQTSPDFE